MTHRLFLPLLTGLLVACGGTSPEPVAPPTAPPPSASAELAPAPEPAKAPEPPAEPPEPRPPPPLSSPNPLAPAADAGAPDSESAADAAPEDGRTRALRAVAKAAQDCHASHVPTARGSVLLRLGLAPDGSVSKAEVRQADSGFTSKAFQSCVTEAARRQRFPASSDDETELEIPLRFDPIQ